MHEVKIYPEKNVLLIQVSGDFSDLEIKLACDELISKASKLKPGFDFINDSTKLKLTSHHDINVIQRAQSFLLKSGVGRIVRVTDDPNIKEQYIRAANQIGYTAIEVSCLNEAFEILEL